MAIAMLAIVGVSSHARANVDPYGENARFVSVGKKNECGTRGYTAEGYMVDPLTKNKIPNSTWHTWDGTLRLCSGTAVFAWAPSNQNAELTVTLYADDKVLRTATFRGNVNYCVVDDGGTVKESFSDTGKGGSGDCTAGT